MSRPKSLGELFPALKRILRCFWPYLARHRSLVAGSAGALAAGTVLRLLEPWPLKYVFDYILPVGDVRAGGSLPWGLERLEPLELLTAAAVAVVVLSGLRALVDYFKAVGFAIVGNRVLAEVRAVLFRHLQALSLAFHRQARGGDLVVRVIGDVNMVKDAVVTALLPLAASILVLVGMWSVMFWMEWRLALAALVTLPVVGLRSRQLSRRIREAAHKSRQRQGAMAATAAESIGAIEVVQALALESRFSQAFAERNQKSLKDDVKASRLSAELERSVDVLLALATALVLWYGARLVLTGHLTPGDLLVFLTYVRRAFRPISDFAKYLARIAKAVAAGERVVELLEQAPEVQDLPGAVPAPRFRGAVRFENVHFAYRPSSPVLEGIELQVQPGERVALVGPSGIGKSTLLSLLLRLYDPTSGRVIVDGEDVRQYTIASLRSQMSVVLQDTALFRGTIRENIRLDASNVDNEQIEAAARLAGAYQFIMALPEGYDSTVGERGVTLSQGERQRIALARAAVRQAPLLLLDEPTTGLDEENERAVVEALERLASGRTVFLVTHDLRLASRADVIVYLERGRIVERGTHKQLIAQGGRYATLYRLQAAEPGQVPEQFLIPMA